MDAHTHGESSVPLRVLLDLSYTTLGFAGIPQESRLVLKSLSTCDGVETTGLLYGVGNNALLTRIPASGRPERVLEKQARFLRRLFVEPWDLSWRGLAANPSALLAVPFALTRQQLPVLFRRHITLRRMDSEAFWDVLWRRALSPTLDESDRPLARTTPIQLANLSNRMMNCRSYAGLPSPRVDTRNYDFVLFHEARGVRVSPTTCKLVRHYDLVPLVRPDLNRSEEQIRAHTRSVRRAQGDSVFASISEASRQDLIRVFPALAERSVTIPCTLAPGYYPERIPGMVARIVSTRECYKSRPDKVQPPPWPHDVPYLLVVATIEPRKNHLGLIRAFETIHSRHKTDLRMMFVGDLGWMYKDVVAAMKPLIGQGRLVHLEKVPLPELRVLYSHAAATVFPSFYEGFGYSPLESMCCDTPAIASDIPVHRGVYGPAAMYCDPYSADSIARAVERLVLGRDDGLRQALVERGRRRVARYQVPAVAAQWRALLTELRRQGITSKNVGDARLAGFNDRLREIEDDAERGVAPDVLPFPAAQRQAA